MSCDDAANCLETSDDLQDFLRGLLGGRCGPRTASVLVSGEPGSGKSHHVLSSVEWVIRASREQHQRPHSAAATSKRLVDACVLLQPSAIDVFRSFQKATGRSRLTGIVEDAIREATASLCPSTAVLSSSAMATDGEQEVAPKDDDFVGTLVVLLDRFDMFLGSASLGSSGDEINDGDGGFAAFPDLHLVLPQFVAEYFTLINDSSFSNSSGTMSVSSATDARKIRWRCVYLVTTTPAAAADHHGGHTATPSVHPVLAARLFHWQLHVHPPAYASRRAYFEDRLGHSVAGNEVVTGSSEQMSHILASAAEGLAGRTGGLAYGGMNEVLEAFSEELALCYEAYDTEAPCSASLATAANLVATNRADDDIAAVKPTTSAAASPLVARSFVQCIASSVSWLCDAAMRRFFASNSQQAIAAKQRVGYVDVVETRWTDIAGLHAAKEQLRRLVMEPVKRTAMYDRLVGCGVRPSIGVVLHGPPGTGKTMLAKAMATELKASFVYLDLPQLIHSEVGSSEATLQQFFDVAKRRSPCVMFLDEVQAAFGSRSIFSQDDAGDDGTSHHHNNAGDAPVAAASSHDARLVSCFMSLLDEAQESTNYLILFVCATNAFHLLDPLLLRAGRLDTHIHIGNPDAAARAALVRGVVDGRWARWWEGDGSTTSGGSSSASAVLRRGHAVRDALKLAFVTAAEGMSGAEICNALNVFALSLLSEGEDVGGTDIAASMLLRLVVSDGDDVVVDGGATVPDVAAAATTSIQWAEQCRVAFALAFPKASPLTSDQMPLR